LYLVGQELEGGLPDRVVDVEGAVHDEAEDELGHADVLEHGPADERTRVAAQVKQEGLDHGAVRVARILEERKSFSKATQNEVKIVHFRARFLITEN
jgi:hypothetical protein